MGSYFINNIG